MNYCWLKHLNTYSELQVSGQTIKEVIHFWRHHNSPAAWYSCSTGWVGFKWTLLIDVCSNFWICWSAFQQAPSRGWSMKKIGADQVKCYTEEDCRNLLAYLGPPSTCLITEWLGHVARSFQRIVKSSPGRWDSSASVLVWVLCNRLCINSQLKTQLVRVAVGMQCFTLKDVSLLLDLL